MWSVDQLLQHTVIERCFSIVGVLNKEGWNLVIPQSKPLSPGEVSMASNFLSFTFPYFKFYLYFFTFFRMQFSKMNPKSRSTTTTCCTTVV